MSHYVLITERDDRFSPIIESLSDQSTRVQQFATDQLDRFDPDHLIDLILIDVEVCSKPLLRRLKTWGSDDKTVPVLVLADTDQVTAAAAALQQGAHQYLLLDETGHTLALLPTLIKQCLTQAEEINGRKSAEDSVLHLAKELSIKHQELEAFAHTVASDLKNPLSTIMGFVEFLEDNRSDLPDAQVQTYLDRIHYMSQQSVETIESLLLFSKVDKQYVEHEPVAIQQVLEGVMARLNTQIESLNATLFYPNEWPICEGYTPWVEKICYIYINNALKYGGAPPMIELGYDYLGEDRVRVWIKDNGSGIAAEQKSAIFDPFTRLTNHTATGSGLNLSIVQRLALRMNGQVGLESKEGQGATFFFTLPLFTQQKTTLRNQQAFNFADIFLSKENA